MNKIVFSLVGSTIRGRDAAYVPPGTDPLDALVEAVVQSISTDIQVTVGDVTMHLAAWQDPQHWSEDWEEKGINPDDVWQLVADQAVSG